MTEKNDFRKIRIGNDLRIKWDILTNGEPVALQGRNLTLVLSHRNGARTLDDFTVDGNSVLWSFPGMDQKWTGCYILTLYENRGIPGMAAIDTTAFELVARMFDTNGLQEPEEQELGTGEMVVLGGSYPIATEEYAGLMSPQDKTNIRLLMEAPVMTAEQAEEIVRDIFNEQ